MALVLATLKTEITTDPATLGLIPMSDEAAAAALNLVRAGAAYAVWRGVIPSYEIINATDAAEWAAATSAEKQRYQTLTGAGQVDVSNSNVQAAFASMFAANSVSRPALLAMAKRQASRSEVLFGNGVTITPSNVADARRLP